MRLYVLLTKQEETYICNTKEWVVREALNLDALQEAGTFRYWDEGPGRGGSKEGHPTLPSDLWAI